MHTAYSTPILIPADQNAVVLQRVALESASANEYNEAWLQKLLYRHPEALPIAEINESFLGLIPICRELRTAAGPIDVLYATSQGRIAVLEAKLWRNPEARRQVIGQILDYAKELSRSSYEDLDGAVRAARHSEWGAPQSLFRGGRRS
jgi:RecB family endonuclease NucS